MYASPEVAKRIKAEGLNTGKVRISELEYEEVKEEPAVSSFTVSSAGGGPYTLPSDVKLPTASKSAEIYSKQMEGFVTNAYGGKETAIVRMPTVDEQAKINQWESGNVASTLTKKFKETVVANAPLIVSVGERFTKTFAESREALAKVGEAGKEVLGVTLATTLGTTQFIEKKLQPVIEPTVTGIKAGAEKVKGSVEVGVDVLSYGYGNLRQQSERDRQFLSINQPQEKFTEKEKEGFRTSIIEPTIGFFKTTSEGVKTGVKQVVEEAKIGAEVLGDIGVYATSKLRIAREQLARDRKFLSINQPISQPTIEERIVINRNVLQPLKEQVAQVGKEINLGATIVGASAMWVGGKFKEGVTQMKKDRQFLGMQQDKTEWLDTRPGIGYTTPREDLYKNVDILAEKIVMARKKSEQANLDPFGDLYAPPIRLPVTATKQEIKEQRERLANVAQFGGEIVAMSLPLVGTGFSLLIGAAYVNKGVKELNKSDEPELTYALGEEQGYTREQIDEINMDIKERNGAKRFGAYGDIVYGAIPLIRTTTRLVKGFVQPKAIFGRVATKSIRNYRGVGTKGKDIFYIGANGKTIGNEVRFGAEELARSGTKGSYTIVKSQSTLGKLLGREPKLVYAGIPVSKFNSAKLLATGLPVDKVAREQAIKLLQRTGYTTAGAKQILRFQYPRGYSQGREFARLFADSSGKTVRGTSVTYTRQPRFVVDSELGIRTRGGREVKDVTEIWRRSFNVGDKQRVAELSLTKTYIPSKSATIPQKEVIRLGLSKGFSKEGRVYTALTQGGGKGQVYKEELANYIFSKSTDVQIVPRARGVRTDYGETILVRREVPVLTVEETGASTRKISKSFRKLPEPTPPIKPTQPSAPTTTTQPNVLATQEVRKTTQEGIGGLIKAESLNSIGIDAEISSITASPLLKEVPKFASPVISKTYLPTPTTNQVKESNLLLRGALLTTGITKLNVGIKERLVLTPTEKVANEYLTKAEPQFKMDIQQQTLMKEIQTSTSKISPTLKKEIKLEVKPIQEIKLDQTTKLKTRPTLKRPRDLILKEKLKRPPITIETKGKLQEIASKIGTEEFEVFAKAFGKDVSIGKFTTKERAKEKLIGELRGTLRASGFIQKGEKKLKVSELGILSTEFGRSKREEYRLVQRKESRFGGFGERKEVQYFRKKSKGGFGL
jgi:hypothetical protein